ncbi:MAG: metallophosphoesterase [Terriglobia bacterium]
MRRTVAKALVLLTVLTSPTLSQPYNRSALQPYPGTGMFLMLSDLHFDPYADPTIMEQLGAKPLAGCQTPGSGSFSKFGSDTNYPLLKSVLDHVVATSRANHFHYDYVIVTGDFLAHNFDARYRQCVGGGDEAYRKFASDTISFVDGMLAKALPGVPVFAALGNNDSDKGDYTEPSDGFLQSVGRDWSRAWGNLPAATRATALVSFERAGNYAAPNPAVPKNEFVILNSNLWAASNTQACSESDPDPGGQFQWLEQVLGKVKRAGGTATLIMHVLPGIDSIKSSSGAPRAFWTEDCTQKLIAELTDFRGVVREMYAGHIHRDDFRLFPDREGRPLCVIHIVPAVSPVYLDNPAVEIGWYDKSNGELRDYATLSLDLDTPKPTWTTEYIFTRAYGRPRPNLAALVDLCREIHEGNPNSGVGKQYAKFYGVGVGLFLTSANWSNYSCAQTEITVSRFAQCRGAEASPRP